MRAIQIQGQEHKSAQDALVELNFTGDRAISVGGRFFTVDQAEFRRIEDQGIQPTTWHDHLPTGRIITVPGIHG